jgi:hypothetical protein
MKGTSGMIYLIATFMGLVASAFSLMLLAKLMANKYRGIGAVEVGINILSPLPMALAVAAFALGFYLVIRISK